MMWLGSKAAAPQCHRHDEALNAKTASSFGWTPFFDRRIFRARGSEILYAVGHPLFCLTQACTTVPMDSPLATRRMFSRSSMLKMRI